jgi:hypothetical protein
MPHGYSRNSAGRTCGRVAVLQRQGLGTVAGPRGRTSRTPATVRRPAIAGRQPDPGCCVLRENHRFLWRIACFCVFLASHVLCGPSVAVLMVDPPCRARRDALDGLTVAATLAHELCWTCVCREDPRRCAADFRRLCPFNCVGICPRL